MVQEPAVAMKPFLPSALATAVFRKPLTPQTLAVIAQHLAAPLQQRTSTAPDCCRPLPPLRRGGRSEAAVLIPLVNLQPSGQDVGAARPGMLLQLRPGGMRMHAGEVSFPGGKCDPTDQSLYHTALREAHEELGIHPNQVEYVGRLKLRRRNPTEEVYLESADCATDSSTASLDEWDDGPIRSLGGLLVWAFVGFVHPPDRLPSTAPRSLKLDEPLSALPLASLTLSPHEVLHVIPLPFDHLLPFELATGEDATNLVKRRLRIRVTSDRLGPGSPGATLGQDYLAVRNLEDLINSADQVNENRADSHDLDLASLEVWGLTAWMMNVLFVRLGLLPALQESMSRREEVVERDEDLVKRLSERLTKSIAREEEEADDNVLSGCGRDDDRGSPVSKL